MLRCSLLLLCICLFAGCQKAQQYPPLGKKVEVKEEKITENESMLREWSWVEPAAVRDTPIVFVAEGNAEWATLKKYWNEPPPALGLPTIHIGFAPLEIAASWAMVEQSTVVKIKVPRGLPDPTPHVPAANPPSLGKWRLGKALFNMTIAKSLKRNYSCATCHDPRRAFGEDPSNPAGTKRSVPSLLNVVYNRRQFWDGRVETLEETVVRSLDDERGVSAEKALERGLEQHVWGNWVRELVKKKDKDLSQQFAQAFGVEHPTQGAVAQALATYMRTLLSGDSLFDQATEARQTKDLEKSAALFASLLKDEHTAQTLRDSYTSELPKRDELAALWAKGHELFHGTARCAQCHKGPLLTDQDFHNIGCDPAENWKTSGRAVQLPPGLKEAKYMGAFRTPTLRNLKGKHAYFHDGSKSTLYDVVDFYDHGVMPLNPYVSPLLKNGVDVRFLVLNKQEKMSLVVYLRSMEGQPLDPVLTSR